MITNEPKQDSQHQLRSPMPGGRLIYNVNLENVFQNWV